MKKQLLLLTLLVGGITSLNAAEDYTAAHFRDTARNHRMYNEEIHQSLLAIGNQEKLLEEAEIQLTKINDTYISESGITDPDIDSVLASITNQIKMYKQTYTACHILEIIQNNIINLIDRTPNEEIETTAFYRKYKTLEIEATEQDSKIQSLFSTINTEFNVCLSNITTQLNIRLAKLKYDFDKIMDQDWGMYTITEFHAAQEKIKLIKDECSKLEFLRTQNEGIIGYSSQIFDPEIRYI